VNYRPRRASSKWLDGAPKYILDVFDNGGKTTDRYTVLLGGDLLDPHLLKDRLVHCLIMDSAPWHPQGVSQWDEWSAGFRPHHQRIRWLELPENIRNHVIARVSN